MSWSDKPVQLTWSLLRRVSLLQFFVDAMTRHVSNWSDANLVEAGQLVSNWVLTSCQPHRVTSE